MFKHGGFPTGSDVGASAMVNTVFEDHGTESFNFFSKGKLCDPPSHTVGVEGHSLGTVLGLLYMFVNGQGASRWTRSVIDSGSGNSDTVTPTAGIFRD